MFKTLILTFALLFAPYLDADSEGKPDELLNSGVHLVDIHSIQMADAPLLAYAREAAESSSGSHITSHRSSKKWVKWVWIGGIVATVALIGIVVLTAVSHGGPFAGLDGP